MMDDQSSYAENIYAMDGLTNQSIKELKYEKTG